jgi:zinc finger protein
MDKDMDKDIPNSIFFVNCPVCGSDNILTLQDTTEIPQYGKIMLITVKCNDCSYKFSEIFDLEGKPPRRYILKCKDLGDLNARIIKSSNSTIHIPELEIDINPGPASEGYITNVEGVL